MKKVSYTEALVRWNAYMINTETRDYCQQICHGLCCKEIPGNCRGYCNEKLPCVAYLCYDKERKLETRDMQEARMLNQYTIHVALKELGSEGPDCIWTSNYNKGTKLRRILDKADFYIPKFRRIY